MIWLDHVLAYIVPARILPKLHVTRVDDAFSQASEARNRKIEAADETITANVKHRERVEDEAALIRARTQEQEAKWPDGRTNDIRVMVESMLRSMEPNGRKRKGDRS